jgi:hypothetical protein
MWSLLGSSARSASPLADRRCLLCMSSPSLNKHKIFTSYTNVSKLFGRNIENKFSYLATSLQYCISMGTLIEGTGSPLFWADSDVVWEVCISIGTGSSFYDFTVDT